MNTITKSERDRIYAIADLLYIEFLSYPHMALSPDQVTNILIHDYSISQQRARHAIYRAIRRNRTAGDQPLRIYPHEHLARCVVCGEPTYQEHQRTYDRHWACCSEACHEAFKARVDEIVERRHPGLLARSPLVLDPYVGDESAIAKLSARSRIADELTFPVRWQIARFYLDLYQLDVQPGHVLILAERAPGSNSRDVLVDGIMYAFYEGGLIKRLYRNDGTHVTPQNHYGYYHERVPGGWQEHRPADDCWERKFLADAEMRAPRYGDVEGADALSVVEHGFAALPVSEPDKTTET